MLSLLDKIIPVYIGYRTKEGYTGVRARTWHPAWFIPVWLDKIRYWSKFPKRYREYQDALIKINRILLSEQNTRLKQIEEVMTSLDCGYNCDFMDHYGFVPEAGCPIHDSYPEEDDAN